MPFKGGNVCWCGPTGPRHASVENSSDCLGISIPFVKIIEKRFSLKCILPLARADKGNDNVYNQAMEFHNLARPELIILIFGSGLGQHCAEWSSGVPNPAPI